MRRPPLPRRHRPRALLRALLCPLVVALAACERRDALSPRDSAFVATMVELRRVPAGAPGDSAARRAVLSRRRVTPRDLEAIATELAGDPARAVRVWRQIDAAAAAAPVPVVPPAPPDSARSRPRGTR